MEAHQRSGVERDGSDRCRTHIFQCSHVCYNYFMNKQGQGTKRSFSLIEMIVTLAIIGMLTITILPTLGRYSRINNVTVSAQILREALNEARSYAVSPDPTQCALASGESFTEVINNYSLFVPAPGSVDAVTPPYDPNTGGVRVNYKCGGVSILTTSGAALPPLTIQSNQYAIMARHIDKANKEYNVGIVRIGTFESPAVASIPIDFASAKPTMIGYNSPSGSYFASGVTGFNYTPSTGNKIFTPNGIKDTVAVASGQYTVIGLTDNLVSPNYQITVFVHNATGQITSDGSTPSGFN